MKRKTDNTPVTDESLAGVRDEIAEAYSHSSPDTITLDVTTYPAALYAAHEELNRLRSQLDEAVTLLADLHNSMTYLSEQTDDHACDLLNNLRHGRYPAYRDARSFLARLDGGKVQS